MAEGVVADVVAALPDALDQLGIFRRLRAYDEKTRRRAEPVEAIEDLRRVARIGEKSYVT